ncbi:O-antigen ligase family protein [Sphingomonas sp. PP-CE-1A-559]|uniref:O-antigen ligase family protein n=1 Tax=Sphingomonas sp. PP-CE-1A-559 TaxID=2135657 RepID=UPI001404DA2A|nr:O-antigen ligase family protein [Sphingomonas sp. PP-CE-1A-559]
MLLLGAFAGIIALQLIPLPPEIWQALPGHARFIQAAALEGVKQPWRPISLQPDLTESSLLALTTPLVILLGFAALPRSQRPALVTTLVIIIAVSAFWGILQITSAGSGARLYRLSNVGEPLGLFANRNHQAALLAAGFPILRLWLYLGPKIDAVEPSDRTIAYLRIFITIALSLILLPTIVLTGSRTGLLLGVMGLGGALLIAPTRLPIARGRNRWAVRAALLIVPMMLLVAMILFGRAVALDRLFASDLVGGEQRVIFAPITFAIALAFLPFGSGFGTFDSVFRIYEPDSVLKPSYFNHAHNDLVELLLTGGLPAVALLLGLALWMLARVRSVFRRPERSRKPERAAARAGMIVIAILFVASITDYPLRTPLLAGVFALMICWIAADHSDDRILKSAASREGRLYDHEPVD